MGCDSSLTPSWDLLWDFWGRRWQFHFRPGAAIADFFFPSLLHLCPLILLGLRRLCQALCKGDRVVRRALSEMWVVSGLDGWD